MTPRDRTVAVSVGALVILAAVWFLLLAPISKEAKGIDDQIAAAQGRLAVAESTLSSGKTAESTYARDYAGVARLGKAVPADDDVPSLIVQLDSAAKRSRVDFRSIELSGGGTPAPAPAPPTPAAPGPSGDGATGASGASGASGPIGPSAANAAATEAAAAALPPGSVVGEAGFPTLPFDFTFNGSFFRLQDFFDRLDRFTEIGRSKVVVRGRLLTVQGFSLGAGSKGFSNLTATVNATAYVLPADQGLLAGAGPLVPAASIPPPAAGPPPGASAPSPSEDSPPASSAAVPSGSPTP